MDQLLKIFGVVLAGVLGLIMVEASVSSADLYTSEVEPTDLTGTTIPGIKPSLKIGGTEIHCEKSTFIATVVKASIGEVTTHPIYDGPCEITGIGKVTAVDTQGCDYTLTGTTETSEGETHATVSVTCTSGKEILITTGLGITLHIPGQGPLLGVTYIRTIENKIDTLTVTATAKSITYTCTGAFCGLLENKGNGTNGVYTDDVSVTGFEDIGNLIHNSTTHEWSGSHGAQVGITVSE